VICKRELFKKASKYAGAKSALQYWFKVATAAEWRNLEDILLDFPAADMVESLAVFNIKGNQYRLIVRFVFASQRVYIKEFLTHAESSKGAWKKWLP
jgi:mRNA interferase HigB